MPAAAQLTLDLPHRPARGREDFLIAPSNRQAIAWIDLWPDWPGPALVLFGPPGCGKSHLLAVWASQAGARVLDAGGLSVEGLDAHVGDAMAVAVDNADMAPDPIALLHLHNMMRDRSGHLLLATRTAPGRWHIGPADLKSRIAGASAAELLAPEDELLGPVMMKLFTDRQLRVPPDVLSYLLVRMPRSFDAARRIVTALDKAGLSKRKAITVSLARDVLAELDIQTAEA